MASVVGHWGGGRVWRITSGSFSSNAYFCEVDGGGILIDPGLDGPAIDAALRQQGLQPRQVFCTHGHFDHVGSAALFQQKYGCPVFVHKADQRTVKTSNFLLMAIKIPHKIVLPDVTWVEHDSTHAVGAHTLRYLAAPGHTPGSCVLELGSAWFTGDTLYSRGIGLSHLPGEDQEQLKASIRALWPGLDASRTIYPGHGNAADGLTLRTENRALLHFLGMTES
jgi:hydroxyacylglutathione hydrolase